MRRRPRIRVRRLPPFFPRRLRRRSRPAWIRRWAAGARSTARWKCAMAASHRPTAKSHLSRERVRVGVLRGDPDRALRGLGRPGEIAGLSLGPRQPIQGRVAQRIELPSPIQVCTAVAGLPAAMARAPTTPALRCSSGSGPGWERPQVRARASPPAARRGSDDARVSVGEVDGDGKAEQDHAARARPRDSSNPDPSRCGWRMRQAPPAGRRDGPGPGDRGEAAAQPVLRAPDRSTGQEPRGPPRSGRTPRRPRHTDCVGSRRPRTGSADSGVNATGNAPGPTPSQG